MSYQNFISSLDGGTSKIHEEDIGLWLSLSADEKAKMIEETKELGTEDDIKYLLEAAEAAKAVPDDEKMGIIDKWKKFVKGSKEGYAKAQEKMIDPAITAKGGIGKASEYVGKKLGIKSLERSGAAGQDSAAAAKIARKLGASSDTAMSVGDKVETGSKAVRKFASEHGGKMAAAAAAGLGALGLVKALRRRKQQQASAEA